MQFLHSKQDLVVFLVAFGNLLDSYAVVLLFTVYDLGQCKMYLCMDYVPDEGTLLQGMFRNTNQNLNL
jgi:hypothetical protein